MARDIAAWLDGLGLGRYAEAFAENEIDLGALPHVTEDDLREIGVALGARRKLLAAIAELDDREAPSSAAPGPAERPAGSGAERRQLTVMFVDLVGSTELSARLDPEDLREVMRAYQNLVAGEIARYEGHVAKFMGDGVLVYFGYPKAHEDEAERAVRAGLFIARAVRELAVPGGGELNARVGIATGQVVIGDLIGEGAAQEEAVIGETPNLAARLQELAAPGAVVVASGTRDLLGDFFELAELGPQAIKGFAQPVRVWSVSGEQAVTSRFEAVHGQGLTRFVGREQELALLEERWRRAKDGEGQVVLLSGEAGIGKSRITGMLLSRVEDEPHTRLRYQCSPHYTNTAFYPFISQLERAAGFARDDAPEAKLDKLEALLSDGPAPPAETVPLFAALLSVPTDDRFPSLEMTAGQVKQRTQRALLEALSHLAARQPVLVLFEDAHWADPTTMEILEQMVDRVQSAQVLVVITYRPELQPTWTQYAHTTTLALDHLTRRHGTAMVEDLTGGKALPTEVVDEILKRTDGVPLFLEELTKTVLESPLIEEHEDAYVLTGPLVALTIPSTLRDSLTARLDRLDSAKEIAQTGAVIGREFSHDLLARVSGLDERELNDALDQLVASGLAFRRGAGPGASFAFKHALVQDVAYESLLKRKRRALHARIVEVLEGAFPQLVETEPELLAHHCTRAELDAAAVRYWLRAGQRAASRSANVEAVRHLRTGLEILARLPESAERDGTELAYLISLGPALMATQGWDAKDVTQVYSRSGLLARETGQAGVLFPALWGLWLAAHAGGAAERARELLKELFQLAEEQGDATLLLQAHHAGGSTMCSDGTLHKAHHHIEAGIALYRREQHAAQALQYGGHDPCVCAHSIGALNHFMLGHLDRAEQYSQRALEMAPTVDHRPTVAHALWYRAELSHLRGDAAEAGRLARSVLEIAEPLGLAQYVAWTRMVIGWSRAVGGELHAGVEDVERGLADLRGVGARYHLAHRLIVWAQTLALAGDVDGARRAFAEAAREVKATGERWYEPEVLRLTAEFSTRARVAAADEVEGLLRRAISVSEANDSKLWTLRAATTLARTWRDQGKSEDARALLAPVYDCFTEGFDAPDLKQAKALLNQLS